jgi:hypothetical protein
MSGWFLVAVLGGLALLVTLVVLVIWLVTGLVRR